MAITDLSSVQTKMFGVSLLGEENKAMLQHWNDRFAPSNSFFVAAGAGDSVEDIARNILQIIRKSEVRVMDDMLMLALFLDLRKPLDPEVLQRLLGLPKLLQELLNCQHILINVFGYTGLIAFGPKQIIKENILLFQEVDKRTHKLWLVADDAQGSEQERWKSTIVFLDFLRRHSNPYALLNIRHNEGSVGILHYNECQSGKRNHFEKMIAQLQKWLEAGGTGDFRDRLRARLDKLAGEARSRFQVDGKLQPLHPDMFPKGFFDVQKAKKNKEPFHTARTMSQSAITATGADLTQQIRDFFYRSIPDAKAWLVQLLEEANVSLPAVDNRQELKKHILSLEESYCDPDPIYLPYDPNGYELPVRKYLEDTREAAVLGATNEMLKRLADACDKLSADKIREKRVALSHSLEESRIKLAALPELSKFCQTTFVEGKELYSPVHVQLSASGSSRLRILMCAKTEDRNWINANVRTETLIDNYCICYIDEHTGGVARPDDASVKCVFATYFDCTEARLNDMLSLGG